MRFVKTALTVCFVLAASPASAAVDSHTIYLDNCAPNGCTVKSGKSDGTTDTSDLPGKTSYLTAFSQTTLWPAILACAQTTFAAFDVKVTDQRPASGAYFSVKVGGVSTELGVGTGVLQIADTPCTAIGTCSPFLSKALAFAFANDPFFTNRPNEICSSIANALGSVFALDHVVDATDAMTFNTYNGVRSFHDGEACGSDCQNGLSPFGSTCTGTGPTATHVCVNNGAAKQDEVQMLLAVFGAPPTAAITSPTDGASVTPGFGIDATCTTQENVTSIALTVDGAPLATLTTAPYHAQAPNDVALGSHIVAALCTTEFGMTAAASAHVNVVAAAIDAGVPADAALGGADAGTSPSSSGCSAAPDSRGTAPFALIGLVAALARRRTRSRQRAK